MGGKRNEKVGFCHRPNYYYNYYKCNFFFFFFFVPHPPNSFFLRHCNPLSSVFIYRRGLSLVHTKSHPLLYIYIYVFSAIFFIPILVFLFVEFFSFTSSFSIYTTFSPYSMECFFFFYTSFLFFPLFSPLILAFTLTLPSHPTPYFISFFFTKKYICSGMCVSIAPVQTKACTRRRTGVPTLPLQPSSSSFIATFLLYSKLFPGGFVGNDEKKHRGIRKKNS